MIPYEDLVSALTNWRIQQGLPVGDADYLGEPRPLEFNLPVTESTEAEAHTGEADILEESFDTSMEGYETSEDFETAADDEAATDFENLHTGDYDEEAVASSVGDDMAEEDIDIHDEPTAFGGDADEYSVDIEGSAPAYDEEDTAFAALDNLDEEPEAGINETQELSIDDADVSGEGGFEDLDGEETAMSPFETEDDPEK